MAELQVSPQRSEVARELAENFLLDLLAQFRGLKDPREAVLDFIDLEMARKEDRSNRAGAPMDSQTAWKARQRLLDTLRGYMSAIMRIIRRTCDAAIIEFADQDLRVVQVRTDFDFHNWLVKILFVIDATPEEALQFRRVLNTIEYAALTEEPFISELDLANRRTDSADMDHLRRRYPYTERFRTRFVNPDE
jgi:hypothetical protein